jgi:cytochrome b subunit of formate dehydrogenase
MVGILAALLVMLAGVGDAWAEECATCHPDVRNESPVHGSFDCTACHGGMEVVPHPAEVREAQRGSAPCQVCHEQPATLAGSVHAPLECMDCHGNAHAIRPSSDPASPSSPLKQFQTCGVCHADRTESYLSGHHAKALLVMGLSGAPTCSSCHGSHHILAPSDPDSTLSHAHAPETCGHCHGFLLDIWKTQSTHGMQWVENGTTGPVCTTCHPSHSPQRFTQRSTLLKTPETCGHCHGGRFSSYRDSFHGKATSLGFLAAAICSDCHTPHRNLPADDPRSSVAPAHLRETCGHCHGDVPPNFARIDPHVVPSDPKDLPEVYWVWLAMTSLLIGVFGFFGLHDLLWLQRALVGWGRGEFASRPVASGPHVRRFSKTYVRIHVVVVVTFLLLAATGLPLKYHAAAWAKFVTAIPGGIDLTRTLHRIAALVTFGYAFFYLANLAYRAAVRRETGLFWGWRSMVPRGKDLADLWSNLRYFLYLGPRPHFDRWGYWEKFDYFAVFWGIPVIGLSGLMLWFPAFFTRVVPGWTINAAFVVHSDEALLAVGFIFVFHFFHTHLRPESFPLDPVIFTGVTPLARFKEERPAEYERLVAAGELEARIVPAPSPLQLRRARVFGVAAVATGLLLVLAIFWSLLAY